MDTIITIRPYDLENKKIGKKTNDIPATKRQVEITDEVANKLSLFNKEQKGVISKLELEKIKPTLEGFLENLSLNDTVQKLAKSVAIAVNNGHEELEVSTEEFKNFIDSIFSLNSKVYNEELEKKEKTIKEQTDEIRMLQIKQKLLEVAINQANNEEEIKNEEEINNVFH